MMVTLVLVLSIAAAIRAAEEVCYDRLGCFTNGPPYSNTLERPISRLPWAPEVIDTQFLLFTRRNPDQYQVIRALNVSSVFGTNFKPSLKSLFIIHGFVETGDKQWLVEMCQTLLEVSDVNCFCVDWRGGSFALYTQSANNVRVVGAEIAYFLNFLQAMYDYHMSDVHLIGHSLGAHVVGEAGQRQEGIGRGSGLDPAGPYFENTPPSVRLDPTDALFVDVIHTDGSSTALLGFVGFGMKQMVGNVDFFPNGGKRMPGCDQIFPIDGILDDIIAGLQEKLLCSHQMSVKFFTASILRPDGFIGYPASSYSAFKEGSGFPCTNASCACMGYKADEYDHGDDSTISQTFFLNTGDPSNFPRWRYQVTVRVAVETVDVVGTFGVSLCRKEICTSHLTVYSGVILSSRSYTTFVDADADVDPVQRVVFSWKKVAPLFLEPSLGASDVTLYYGPSGQMYVCQLCTPHILSQRFHFCSKDQVKQGINQTLQLCPSPST
ncbi:PREDICTED: pancreatic lipase-related protein 2-like [Nanorana parkeri]|uniref:pancreatic lipase-related protein 2-like n=1 Tax=Nanorana parkeri TaxID=125878 RepID=UPI0008546DB9|nr:PREDICTED: pancreatic lipase-related protein 2-like [Nanorana parkeri]